MRMKLPLKHDIHYAQHFAKIIQAAVKHLRWSYLGKHLMT